MKNLISFARVLCAVFLLFGIQNIAAAKTLYVAKWGTDDADCGARTTPCENIQDAIDNAKKNDKIVVAPGKYEENLVISDMDGEDRTGLKLESESGRYATFIVSVDGLEPVFKSNQTKLQIGKSGKGFTFDGDNLGSSGIEAVTDCTSCKIDGNRFLNIHAGLLVSGERIQIRNNIIEALNAAVSTTDLGIYCSACPKGLIQENTIMNGGSNGIAIESSDGINVLKNRISGGNVTSIGMSVSGNTDTFKLRDNVVEGRSSNSGIEILNLSKVTIQGNIVSGNGNGLNMFGTEIGNGTTIKHNLALLNENNGIVVGLEANIKFESNTAISNNLSGSGQAGMRAFDGSTSFRTFRNNNAYGNTTCDMDNSTGVDIADKKRFTGPLDDLGVTCGTALFTGADSSKPNVTNVKNAAKL